MRRSAECSFLGRTTIDCQALAERGVSEYSFLEMPGCLREAFRAGTLNTFPDFLQTKAGGGCPAGAWKASQGGEVGFNMGMFPPEYAL